MMPFELHPHLCLLITAITVTVATLLMLFGYLKRKISTSAFIGALILGVFILLLLGLKFGYAGLLALLAFFILGNLVTRYKYEEKAMLGLAEGNNGMRDISNVLGNGLSPLIFALFYALSNQNQNPSHNHETLFLLGFAGSVATACADTFSTEIGQVGGEPRSITTFKKVPVGTNGGVSLAGLGAGLLGSSLISFVSLLFVFAGSNASVQVGVIFFILCVIAGVSGCIADSIFGATIEDNAKLFMNLNKHHVNILATLAGGIIAILLGYSLGVRI